MKKTALNMKGFGLQTNFTAQIVDVGKEFYYFIEKNNSNNITHHIIGYPPLCKNWVMGLIEEIFYFLEVFKNVSDKIINN